MRFPPWPPLLAAPSLVLLLAAAAAHAADESALAPESAGLLQGFPDWITAVEFAPDDSLLAAGTYDELRLCDPRTRELRDTLKTRHGYVRDVCFSTDGAQLTVGDYQGFSIWNVATGKRIKRIAGHSAYVTGIAFLDADQLISCSEDGTVRLWNAESGDQLRSIEVGQPVQGIAVSPDRSLLATAAGDPTRPNHPGPVALWNLRTGARVADLVGHERAALAVAFDERGRVLASAGEDEKVNLEDPITRKPIGFYAGHGRSVNAVRFLAHGDLLASVSGGNAGGLCELRLWRSDGTDLAAIEPHERRITSLAATSTGRLLAIGSQDKTVSLWNIGPLLDRLDVPPKKRAPVEATRPQTR